MRGLMHGIKFPQQDFALKMQGAYALGGGGGVFVGHYSINTLTPTDFLQLFYILQ